MQFYYDDYTEKEREFYAKDEYFTDKHFQQLNLIKDLTKREKEIRSEIKTLRETPGGMVFDSVTKNKGITTTQYYKRT